MDFRIAFFALCAIISLASCSVTDELVVQVANGKVRGAKQVGYEGNAVHSFLSIPYAKPPVGPLRFRPPEPAEDWDGILDATKYGSTCIQPLIEGMDKNARDLFQKEDMDEDCLTLDVHVPANPKATKPMAVMVWIHGGGFFMGCGQLADSQSAPNYTLLRGDVILVGMNYRLGPFGFLSTGDENARGNWGLRDQVLALAWVKNNIAAFGGDPQRVTIFGISAGGISVDALLMSPYAKHLFDRGIAQSGVLNNQFLNFDPLSDATRLANKVNCTEKQTDKLVECLRKISARVLIDTADLMNNAPEDYYKFYPVIDGDFLPKDQTGKNAARKDIIIGFIDMEGYSFPSNFLMPNPPEDYMTVRPSMNQADFDEMMAMFTEVIMSLEYGDNPCVLSRVNEAIKFAYTYWNDVTDGYKKLEMVTKFLGDIFFAIPAIQMAMSRDASNGTASTHLYQFKHTSTAEKLNEMLFFAPTWIERATHGADIYFMFAPFLPAYSEKDRKVSEDMVTYWTNFARTGNPNKPSLKSGMDTWEAYHVDSKDYLEFGEHPSRKSTDDLDPMHINFWTEYIPKLVESEDCSKVNADSLFLNFLKENSLYFLIFTILALVVINYLIKFLFSTSP